MASTSTPTPAWKTIITVLFLIFIMPVGIILMWVLTKWNQTAKIVLSVIGALLFIPWLLVTFAIFVELALVVANPALQFATANNAKRTQDLQLIISGVTAYENAHNGQLPTGITNIPTEIMSRNGVDLCSSLVPTYLPSLPQDPLLVGKSHVDQITSCSSYDTGYTILVDANNKVILSAPKAELNKQISVTSQ